MSTSRALESVNREGEPTALHEERLDGVMAHLLRAGVASVLDLGCGEGALLERLLAEPQLRRIVGVDRAMEALDVAALRLTAWNGTQDSRLSLRHGSVVDLDGDLTGFDAAVLVETIEHLDPAHLSRLERGLFVRLKPGRIIVTTPNREYNTVYGLQPGTYRHSGHRFEWDRAKFQRWASGAALRSGYQVRFEGLGPSHAWHGTPTQMAIFTQAGS